MNCAFDKEKLSGYYDGELDAAEKAEVERHIASCSECLRELGELKSAALLIKELPRLRAPRSVAEGVSREIQAAGKVHRFAAVRRNLMWASAVAAALLVVLNVAYFGFGARKEADTVAARSPAPAVLADAAARPAMPRDGAEELRRQEEPSTRRALDRAAERKPFAEDEKRKNLAEGKREEAGRSDKDAAKKPEAPAELAKSEPAPERKFGAAPGAPAPKPEAAAPVVAAKESPRPVAAPPADKAVETKKDAEGLAKVESDPKAKKAAPAEPAPEVPAHFTLASTQMAKARPQVEETLRKLGVTVPTTLKGGMKPTAPSAENTYVLEMTDSQIDRLRQEIAKQSYSRLHAAAPGDQVLAQYGDTGLYRGREKSAATVSGGAAPPPAPAKKPAEKKDDAKDAGKEAEDAQAAAQAVPQATAKAAADKLEKTPEPRRKVVLHLLEVLALPDAQPAGDPVKK